MDEYKPKRIEFFRYNKSSRTIGFAISTEKYQSCRDYYLYINLWWFGFAFVFLRFNPTKD